MESEACLVTIAIGVVVTIVVITLLVAVRDVVVWVHKKMRATSSSQSALPRPDRSKRGGTLDE